MCNYVYYCFVLLDNLLVYIMSEQGTSDAYRQLASSPKDEGTSSQPNPSGYSADTEEGIFILKAQSEESFPPKKRGLFSRVAHERRKRMKKLQQQRAIVRANREVNAQTQETVNGPPWEEELDRQLADFHMLATTAADPNLNQRAKPPLLPLFPNQ
ncbi:hypothetical protein Hanom_Chr10g00920421 [Helianthus anomalus]